MKTAEKQKTKSDLKREQIEKDRKRAEELAIVFEQLDTEVAKLRATCHDKLQPYTDEYERHIKPITDLYEGKIAPVQESLEAAARELLDIGQRQRFNLFDIKGNWRFENGYYIHVRSKTEAVTGPAFDLSKFVKKFAKYVEVKFKIQPLVKLFTDADLRRKSGIDKHDVSLKTNETLEIKVKSENNDKEE